MIVESVCANGGRACVNASGVWTPRHGREIAEAMAEKMARVKPRAWDNPDAELSAFANPDIADRISGMIDGLLANPGAEDLVLKHRGTPRLYKDGRCAWLQPSVVLCDSHQHPLANKEFLFPYASVVEADQDEILELIGPTLVASVITEDVPPGAMAVARARQKIINGWVQRRRPGSSSARAADAAQGSASTQTPDE